jgi:4-amino-4-deoxy-L-arabinose transferase-like glycosyltransferase
MPPLTSNGRRGLLLLALLAALFLRLYRLDYHSIWYDEAATWGNATHARWIDTVMAESNHPPVWWIVTRAWLTVFSGAEAALRMPAALCGVLAVALAYLLARRLADPAHVPSRGGFIGGYPSAPLWVVGFAAVNPFWIEYAQEARMYAAVLAESLLLCLLYLRYLDRGGRSTLVAYALTAALGVYTHYYAVLVVAGHAVHALWLWRRQRGTHAPFSPWPVLAAMTVGGLLFLPWFLVLVGGYRGIFSHPTPPLEMLANALWRMGTGPGLAVMDVPRLEQGIWPVVRDSLLTFVGQVLLWFVPIAFGLRAIWRDRGGRAFVLCSLMVPVGIALLVSFQWTLISEKYLIFLAPFLLYLAVLGALSVRGAWRVVLMGGLVLLHAGGLLAYHGPDLPIARPLVGDHPYGKEQWRDLHRWVVDQVDPGDVVLLHAPFVHVAWDFYETVPRGEPARGEGPATAVAAGVPRLSLPAMSEGPEPILTETDVARLYPQLAQAEEVFLVLSHQTTPDPYYYSGVVRNTLGTLQPAKEWAVEKVVFPRAWGVRVHRFYTPKRGP